MGRGTEDEEYSRGEERFKRPCLVTCQRLQESYCNFIMGTMWHSNLVENLFQRYPTHIQRPGKRKGSLQNNITIQGFDNRRIGRWGRDTATYFFWSSSLTTSKRHLTTDSLYTTPQNETSRSNKWSRLLVRGSDGVCCLSSHWAPKYNSLTLFVWVCHHGCQNRTGGRFYQW